MGEDLNRRDFLGTTGRLTVGGAAALAAFHPAIRTAKGELAPANEKLVVALIGCGGMGGYDVEDFMRAPEVELAALCDVDESHLNERADKVEKKSGKRPKLTKEYREILDNKDIDAVIIGTPDHWHAIPFVAACMAGKDVYCEKPISHNILEGRAMVNAARRYKRVSQIGTQQRSGEHFQKAVKLVQDGKLGRVSLTKTWNFDNESPSGLGKPADEEQAPQGVDYDRWLGPAPSRKFNPVRFHGTFRWFYDYAAGMIGDWNVHLQDIIHWGMNVTSPKSVHAAGGKYTLDDNRDTPDTMVVTYEFEGPQGPFIQVYEMRKGNGHGIGGNPGHGMQFHGTDATLYVDRDGFQVIPEGERTAAIKSGGSDQHWPHVQNFLSCVKSRERCICDIETGHTSTVVCHLGNISYKLGKKIYWDATNELVVHKNHTPDAEANALLGREYRKGYELPKVEPPSRAG
ncbi:MAG TPA: Gfo/Idh/MocA family oxidoreductase [Isosphaeraceae bacterium]|jgi:predicted dehydrogenase|nr:Gfo/Idh/MocA family oxidoreductase [Isosphaeraceae bacterium]